MNGRDDVKYAIESLFLMKKCYIHKLVLSDNSIDFCIRAKGLTTQSILAQAKKCGGLLELYQKLFDGDSVTFNLCDGAPSFAMNKNMTVSSRKTFERTVKTKYELGEE